MQEWKEGLLLLYQKAAVIPANCTPVDLAVNRLSLKVGSRQLFVSAGFTDVGENENLSRDAACHAQQSWGSLILLFEPNRFKVLSCKAGF